MPVEIRELVIKATIVDDEKKQTNEGQQPSGGAPDSLIEECMEQVIQMMKSKTER